MEAPNNGQAMNDVNVNDLLQTSAMPDSPEEQPTQQKPVQLDTEPTVEIDGQVIPEKEIDNLKSYKFFQSKFTTEQQERQKEREGRIRAEERLKLIEQQQIPQPQVQQNQRPVRPVRPQGYNRLDAITITDSISAKYDEAMQDYEDKLYQWNEQQEQIKDQQTEFQRQRNMKISELQTVPGVTLEEATEALNWFTTPDSGKPEYLVAYRRFVKNLQNGKIQPMGQTVGKTATPVTLPSQTVPKTDETQDFVGGFGKRDIKRLFKTQ